MSSIQALLNSVRLPDSPSARVDGEWLLADLLGKPASYLRTWPEKEVPAEVAALFAERICRRQAGEPVAYIIGRQGFWSLELEVAPCTLIPRPDTELLVETALSLLPTAPLKALDLGTGTGAIALALATERPAWQLMGVDCMEGAVALAERNRHNLKRDNARFIHSHWFSALSDQRFACILSNPPYIEADDPHLTQGDVRFEPASALVSGIDGLDDLRQIIAQSPDYLEPQGWLLLEHGHNQAAAVRQLLLERGFKAVESRRDLGGHERISLGQYL